MALPNKTLKKIKIDNSNTYDIAPTMMTDDTGTYKAVLPTLTQDSVIALQGEATPSMSYILQGNTPEEYEDFGYYIDLDDFQSYRILTLEGEVPESNDFAFGQIIYKYDVHMDSLESIWYVDHLDEEDENKLIILPLGNINGAVYEAYDNEYEYYGTQSGANRYDILSPFLIQAVKMNKIIDVTLNNIKYRFYFYSQSSNSYTYQGLVAGLDYSTQNLLYNLQVIIDDEGTSYMLVSFRNLTPISEIQVNGSALTPSMIGVVDITVPTLPAYSSSNENYVLSVNSSGSLTWRPPYDGSASGN